MRATGGVTGVCSWAIPVVHYISHFIVATLVIEHSSLDVLAIGIILYTLGLVTWVLAMKAVTDPRDDFAARCQCCFAVLVGMAVSLSLLFCLDVYCWCMVTNGEWKHDSEYQQRVDDQSGENGDSGTNWNAYTLATAVATIATLVMIMTGILGFLVVIESGDTDADRHPGDSISLSETVVEPVSWSSQEQTAVNGDPEE